VQDIAYSYAQQEWQSHLWKKNKAIKLTDSVKNYISEKLKEYWSPEQIMGRLELDKKIKISTETAYCFESHLCVLYQ
jgi:IS30 family transposase